MNEIKVLVIGDPHFKVNNVRDTDDMAAEIIRVAKETNPDFIVNLGDTLDRHESIHVTPITRATLFMAELKEIAPLYLIIGNHDRKNNRDFCSNEHPFVALKEWERCTVVEDTVVTTIKDHVFTFVPYVQPGRFVEVLNHQQGWEASTAIFAHQEFYGCAMGAITSVEGDQWPVEAPYVVSGHIHDYQQLQNNILYVGTPIQHSFGCPNNKAISLITFSSPTLRVEERIKLNVRGKKIIHLNAADVDEYRIKKADRAMDLKIIIQGTSGELKTILKHPKVIEWKKAGHKIIHKDIPHDYDESEILRKPTLKYSKELYRRVRKDEVMKAIYHEIYSS